MEKKLPEPSPELYFLSLTKDKPWKKLVQVFRYFKVILVKHQFVPICRWAIL